MKVHAATQALIDQINEFVSERPATVRAIYYHLVTIGALPSSDASYNKVKRDTANARRAGSIKYTSIVDNGRRAHRRASWESLADRAESAKYIHLDPWIPQNDRVFVVVEKDAALHLIEPICDEYDVKVFPLRRDSSLTFLYEIAKEVKPAIMHSAAHLAYWGDFDPGGMSIGAAAERGIREILFREFCTNLEHSAYEGSFTWTRLGINREDMDTYNLLPIPCKAKDTKLKKFLEDQGLDHGAEIDALPAEVIEQRTKDFIESHINQELWDATKAQHEIDEAHWLEMLGGTNEEAD